MIVFLPFIIDFFSSPVRWDFHLLYSSNFTFSLSVHFHLTSMSVLSGSPMSIAMFRVNCHFPSQLHRQTPPWVRRTHVQNYKYICYGFYFPLLNIHRIKHISLGSIPTVLNHPTNVHCLLGIELKNTKIIPCQWLH